MTPWDKSSFVGRRANDMRCRSGDERADYAHPETLGLSVVCFEEEVQYYEFHQSSTSWGRHDPLRQRGEPGIPAERGWTEGGPAPRPNHR